MSEIISEGQSSLPTVNAQQPLTRLSRFLLLVVQLTLVAAVVYLFEIEQNRSFFPVLCVIFSGFAIHAWLPRSYQPTFFALLSVGCLLLVLGLTNGAVVLGIGAALIGLCHVPVGYRGRLALLAVAAAVLAVLRGRFSLPFWPVLGSMFMFRLALYFYEHRHRTLKPNLAESVSYMFMLPNVCFPLFPVVDFRTFRECWFDEDEYEIYQRGITWIVTGLAHLLLYRYISAHLVPEPYELYDVPHLALFMVTNYALYLRVSGQFHVIAGILHLFGFRLPRTHHHFFLASSFTDIWRRINIYWKDFMTKLCFLPTFYAVRSRGSSVKTATVLGVFCVFLFTWMLHSWQTYWLRGSFPLKGTDAFLWLGAGVCVAINAVLDTRRSQRRIHSVWWTAISRAARTIGMFWLISLFWACWTRPDFPMVVQGVMARPGMLHGLSIVGLWTLAALILGTLAGLLSHWQDRMKWHAPAISFRDSALLHAIGLSLVVAFASPWFGSLISEDTAHAIATFRSNESERGGLERLPGYYEDLNATSIQAGPLISAFTPQDESLRAQAAGFAKVSRPSDIYQGTELIPGVRTELNGSVTSINRFSMRDRESITLQKPSGTVRIAVVGSSIVMGYGVRDDEVFSRVFENRLNARRPDPQLRYEVLNFGVGQQWAINRLARIQRQVLGFQPDAIYYFVHQDEFQHLASHLAALAAHGRKLPSQFLHDVVDQAGITPEMAPGAVQSRLARVEAQILGAVYRTMVDECRTHDAIPVWVYLPVPTSGAGDISERVMPIARDAGFVVCNLSDWADGREVSEVLPAPDDPHAHAAGHEIIATALMTMIAEHPQALPPSVGRNEP